MTDQQKCPPESGAAYVKAAEELAAKILAVAEYDDRQLKAEHDGFEFFLVKPFADSPWQVTVLAHQVHYLAEAKPLYQSCNFSVETALYRVAGAFLRYMANWEVSGSDSK